MKFNFIFGVIIVIVVTFLISYNADTTVRVKQNVKSEYVMDTISYKGDCHEYVRYKKCLTHWPSCHFCNEKNKNEK